MLVTQPLLVRPILRAGLQKIHSSAPVLGGNVKLTIPDYKTYQVNEHTPVLLEHQKKLAKLGLKDPWIRNEVWRYDMRENIADDRRKGAQLILRGVLPGLILAIGTSFLWWEYDRRYLAHDHHDDHH